MSADEKGEGPVLGIVASLSDVTRQHELQQTKNDVISLVSHEMRTPLTAIQGMTELLAAYDLDPARRREMNLAINDEVKRLTRMITEYLDITRLESGATPMRLSPVRVESLLERILILLEPVAGQRQIQLVRQFPTDLPAVLADPDLLSRAVENLVSNAIKYSPNGTEVTVSARAEAKIPGDRSGGPGIRHSGGRSRPYFRKILSRAARAGRRRSRYRPGPLAGSRNRGTASSVRSP